MEIKYYDGSGNLENKTIANADEALGFTEQLLIETRELFGKVDVTAILNQIAQKVVATQDKIQNNLRLIELMVATSNGDEVAAKKLKELSTTVADEDAGVEDDEPVVVSPKREPKVILLDKNKKVIKPAVVPVKKKVVVEKKKEENLFV